MKERLELTETIDKSLPINVASTAGYHRFRTSIVPLCRWDTDIFVISIVLNEGAKRQAVL